jgi:hypothetical protein
MTARLGKMFFFYLNFALTEAAQEYRHCLILADDGT